MTYKTILVHLDNGRRAPARLELGVQLAQRFDAHLIGLHVLAGQYAVITSVPEAYRMMIEAERRAAIESAKQVETVFRRLVDTGGLSNAEWRTSLENGSEVVPLQARYTDLVVIGQYDFEDEAGVGPDFPHRLVLTAGRPVLVVPYTGQFATVGKRILLAWNASRESTRATTDALPLLRQAEEVHVVIVNAAGDAHGEVPGADIATYLARHGVRVQVSSDQVVDIDTGNDLLSRAADFSSDLIVMGAYGHSRISELVLGGVTRTMFASMTVPVLMSH